MLSQFRPFRTAFYLRKTTSFHRNRLFVFYFLVLAICHSATALLPRRATYTRPLWIDTLHEIAHHCREQPCSEDEREQLKMLFLRYCESSSDSLVDMVPDPHFTAHESNEALRIHSLKGDTVALSAFMQALLKLQDDRFFSKSQMGEILLESAKKYPLAWLQALSSLAIEEQNQVLESLSKEESYTIRLRAETFRALQKVKCPENLKDLRDRSATVFRMALPANP